ncbi:MAG: copper chaperone PCu(A)C [Paracoccaceae bacterium]
MFPKRLAAAAAVACFALPALAADIVVEDPYARVSTMMSQSGAAFMVIENTGQTDDHLVAVRSDVAAKTELHTHREDDMGVMRMIHVEEGFALPAGGSIEMVRGGRHVMFLGLEQSLEHGDTVEITLEFREAGDVTVTVPVDLERKPMHGMTHGHD